MFNRIHIRMVRVAARSDARRPMTAQQLAYRAMWLGILSGLWAPILAPYAIYFGLRARNALAAQSQATGRRKLLAGAILGTFWLLVVLLVIVLSTRAAAAQDFQGPAGANYADTLVNFGVTGANIPVAVIEHPLINPVRTGIEPDHHLGNRFFGQWDFNGLLAPAWPPPPSPPPADGSCAPPPAIGAGTSDHATLVADVLAGDSTGGFSGVAPGAWIAAGHIANSGTSDLVGGYDSCRAAMGWLNEQSGAIYTSAPPLIYNLSFGYPGNDNGANPLALFVDSGSFGPSPLVVVAAGDDGVLIRQPADAFNCITVGYCDAGLQRRATNSSYALSPVGRAKPDLLAPGENISDGVRTESGDSFSAPMVSGTAALLLDYAGGLSGIFIFGGPQWPSTVRAIILNSARKRFISGLNATNGVSKDNLATANGPSDYDYLDGPRLRAGGTGSGPKTEDWTPANWTKAADGPFITTAPLDDEQGAGLLDVQRALTQMGGPGAAGHHLSGPVPPIGWDIAAAVPPGELPTVQEYSFNFPITNGTFITATLCWPRIVYESDANYHPQRPPAPDCPTDSAFGQVDEADTYTPTNLPHLNLNLYYGTTLIAQSASPVDNLQHLHVPVATDGNPGDYRLEVQWVGGPGAQYSLAWWVGSPFAQTNQVALDFGQAPDPPYPTYLTNNGARHVIVPGFYLGSGVDSDGDGEPFGAANDDDGVSFLTPITPGQPALVAVVASTNGLLNAWLDFNASGNWADAGDQIFTNQPLVVGTNFLNFNVPASAAHSTNSFARFRFSSAAGLSFTGLAPDGEVEDYQVTVTCRRPTLTLTRNGSNFDVTMDTQTNCTCYLEYTSSLTNVAWSPLETVGGTGATVTVTDTNGAAATRFYRARVQ